MEQLELLNDRQREAVLHWGSPLLILAGAGSGKTRAITTKIAYLVTERGMDPRSILAVTFTNKAANEMKNRVLLMVPDALDVMIRTFHSFGAWLLRRNSHLLGLNSNFNIYDEDDSLSLLRQVLADEGADRIARDEIRRYAHYISRAKDKNLSPRDDLRVITHDEILDEYYRLYQERLEKTGNVDFGDLIVRSVDLLRRFPEVKQRIQQRFRVVLVDEYQDANTAQFHLLRELYREDNYLCVVGDEDQSIYGFRGAEVRNILDFPEAFPNTEVIRLEENYRSTQSILETAIHVVENNRERLGKKLWTRKESGEPVVLAILSNENEEARFCAEILRDGNYENTAILYRNNYQSRTFETLFSRLHIPYRLVGTLRFVDREEVKDALAYLSLIINPRDEVSFLRAINKPARGIGKATLTKVLSLVKADYLSACRDAVDGLYSKARSGLKSFLTTLEELKQLLASLPLSEVIRELIHRTGLYDFYLNKDELDGSVRLLNLEELVNASAEYGVGPDALTELLESLTLNSSDEDPFVTDGRVNLITFHNTKGLEFERVIITGLEDGLFPHYRDNVFEEDLELEEERRLFYVAMTRAKEQLFMTTCQMRRVFGVVQNRRPSRFLSEIPSESVKVISSTSVQPEAESFSSYYEGCEVVHPEYGAGIIKRKWYNGEEAMVLVQFSSGRTAQFILKYSNLERIDF
jgi:DNA helicase-2/ATP-dependent DNA helicase PcrA